MKYIAGALTFFATLLFLTPLASAHVIVHPSQAPAGQSQIFTVTMPNERDGVQVTKLKLMLPPGLKYVTPTVLPGWQITTKDAKNSRGELQVAAIIWSGGHLKPGLGAQLSFAAETPEKATNLHWKAYQTYSDGTVVSWDQKPTKSDMQSDPTVDPYSVTHIVSSTTDDASTPSSDTTNRTIAIVALVLSVLALIIALREFLRFPSK
jgi:uncharacterized protein YcnI